MEEPKQTEEMEKIEQPEQPEQIGEPKKGKNIGMAILCYLSILVFIPLLTDAKKDPFVYFHIKQGILLLIACVIAFVIGIVPIIGWIISPILWIITIVLSVIGIINAVSGKEKELPIIGKYSEKIKI